MANCYQGEQEMPKALGSATFISSAGPGAQEECRENSWGGCKWEAPPGLVPQMRLHVFWNRLEEQRIRGISLFLPDSFEF